MPTVPLTYRPQPGEPEDITQIMADFDSMLSVVNGTLEAGTNIRTAVPTALTGYQQQEGNAATLQRSDSQRVVQGFEQLAADPDTGNFLGRRYLNTLTGKDMICTTVGPPAIFQVVGPLAATDLVLHASRHATGGLDALPTGAVGNPMLGRTIDQNVALSADKGLVASAWTDLVTVTFTCSGTQVVTLLARMGWINNGAAATNVAFEFVEGATILGGTAKIGVGASAAQDQGHTTLSIMASFATGTHTVKLRGYKDSGGSIQVLASGTIGGEALTYTRVQALSG